MPILHPLDRPGSLNLFVGSRDPLPSRPAKPQMKIGEPAGESDLMKPGSQALTKLLIHDDEGAVNAFTRDGTIYDVVTAERIAKLCAGQIYGMDGRSLGTRLPSGKVRRAGGKPAAFLKLFGESR